jgi:hypothetical protein
MPSVESESLQDRDLWISVRDSFLWRQARGTRAADFWREMRHFVHEIWFWARGKHVILPSVHHIAKSIAALHSPVSDLAQEKIDAEAPIFLLATGWRTGSTLLQRILVTDPHVFMWGEPLSEMTLVSRITEMLSDSLSPGDLKYWRTQPSLDQLNSSEMATSWIAALSPAAGDFRSALRALFDRWLGDPTRRSGFARWGFKEVRLGAAEAIFLHWLYPKAKFLVLSRHPCDCYVSLSDANFHPLYYRYPSIRVDSAAGFGRHWNHLALSWSQLPEEFPCFHIKYENLVSGHFDFRKLESWLGIEIREDIALSVSVGHSSRRSRPSWYEHWIIAREAAPGMRALGYFE